MDRKDLLESGIALLKWHEQTERDLPWKGETDPYRIWISETMLQQTTAAAVAGRYTGFLQAFPDVFALAAASEEDVLRLWQGLGYYARARNMHKTAKTVVQKYNGFFPSEEAELRDLPGIGEYTACAILSMAYGKPEAAIDANLKRVISRFFGIRGFVEDNGRILRSAGTDWLRQCAVDRPGDFNRALMGIGALVCSKRSPSCEKCPLMFRCEAFRNNEQLLLPESRPKSARKAEWHIVCLVICDGTVLVRKRPDKGMLAGLWEIPHYVVDECGQSAQNGELNLRDEGIDVRAADDARSLSSEFVFTHKIWHLRAWRYISQMPPKMPKDYLFVDAEKLQELPMPSVMEPYRQEALKALSCQDVP